MGASPLLLVLCLGWLLATPRHVACLATGAPAPSRSASLGPLSRGALSPLSPNRAGKILPLSPISRLAAHIGLAPDASAAVHFCLPWVFAPIGYLLFYPLPRCPLPLGGGWPLVSLARPRLRPVAPRSRSRFPRAGWALATLAPASSVAPSLRSFAALVPCCSLARVFCLPRVFAPFGYGVFFYAPRKKSARLL